MTICSTIHLSIYPTSTYPEPALPPNRSNRAETPTSVFAADPTIRSLAKGFYSMRHQQHGELTITRVAKHPKNNHVSFEISLITKSKNTRYTKEMYITKNDSTYHGNSTLGYGDIYLPKIMQGIGVSNLLHLAAAESASMLGVQKVCVDNVVDDKMHSACLRAGFEDNGIAMFNYSGDPITVAQACRDSLRSKGWIQNTQKTSTSKIKSAHFKRPGCVIS